MYNYITLKQKSITLQTKLKLFSGVYILSRETRNYIIFYNKSNREIITCEFEHNLFWFSNFLFELLNYHIFILPYIVREIYFIKAPKNFIWKTI